MMRAGLYRPVHVKTLHSQKLRMLLTHRKLLQSKAIAIENDLRATLRNFGLKVGVVGAAKFEARIKELVESLPDLALLVEPLLVVRRAFREQIGVLHRRLLAIVRNDDVCRRLMTVPGVGPVVALTYRATVDVPARFRNSKAVGAVFGLTPSKYQSGENDRTGGISRCGDEMMRTMLYEAAQILLVRSTRWSWLKAWAMQIARRRGMKKAIVALARRLAVIMHRIWVDGTEFRWTREVVAHDNRIGSKAIGEHESSTERWKDVPRGTTDEVRSYVCLDLPSLMARPIIRLFRLVLESHDGRAPVPIPKRSTSPRATSTP
jgi:transposase